MKPYGRIKKIKGRRWKRDVHPPRGWINWWENMCGYVSRSTLRKIWKQEINEEIDESSKKPTI
jgi:hypothetical protein